MPKDQRIAQRQRCKMTAEIWVNDRRIVGNVVDISRKGMSLAVSPYAAIEQGDSAEIYCKELGMLHGKAVWRKPDRVGIALSESTNTAAKVEAYFRLVRGIPV